MIHVSDLQSLQFIARNMQRDDALEIFATRRNDDADEIAESALTSPHSYIVTRNSIPVTAFGTFGLWPGVWSLWMFSTDVLDQRIIVEVMRHARRCIIPDMLERGMHRAQCESMKRHHKAHDFLERFGGRVESIMRGYGRRGEDFVRYVWDRDALVRQLPKVQVPGKGVTFQSSMGVTNERPVIA